MADNFDLREFLAENKLTKNAKLLNEGSDYRYDAVVDAIADYFDEGSYEYDQVLQAVDDAFHNNQIDTSDFGDDPSAPSRVVAAIADELGLGEYENDEPFTGKYVSGRDIEEAAPSAGMTTKEKSTVVKKAKHGEDIGHKGAGFAKVEKAAEKQYGSKEAGQKVAAAAMWKAQAAKHEQVNENTMTERDKYLTRLVENALGLQVTEDENVDYTMGRHDDPNQLPNPAPELNIPEGEEMVEEKPLPKYENIEKLMQEIDKSTDEAAHKYKMEEMKRVADALESKCTALEEGDDADHIDQKKLKQMKKDVMSLRKNIEKMEKVNEKKFAKKEPKADLKEGFDLRNFLVENKLTTNSRIVEESAE